MVACTPVNQQTRVRPPVTTRSMGGSPGELSEELVTQVKRKKGLRMNCDVGEATEELENELWRR